MIFQNTKCPNRYAGDDRLIIGVTAGASPAPEVTNRTRIAQIQSIATLHNRGVTASCFLERPSLRLPCCDLEFWLTRGLSLLVAATCTALITCRAPTATVPGSWGLNEMRAHFQTMHRMRTCYWHPPFCRCCAKPQVQNCCSSPHSAR